MIVLGLLALAAAFIGLPYLFALGCGMNTTGCRHEGSFLPEVMFDPYLGWIFWLLALAGGALVIWGGALTRSPKPTRGDNA